MKQHPHIGMARDLSAARDRGQRDDQRAGDGSEFNEYAVEGKRRSEQPGRHGLASTLVSAGLREVDRAGLPAWLETSSESNVRFYRTHGFATTNHYGDAAGASLWTMTRPAISPL